MSKQDFADGWFGTRDGYRLDRVDELAELICWDHSWSWKVQQAKRFFASLDFLKFDLAWKAFSVLLVPEAPGRAEQLSFL